MLDMLGVVFFVLASSFVVLMLLVSLFVTFNSFASKKKEFKKRAKEIIELYNTLEKYLIKNTEWSEVIFYPSSFYDVSFKTSKEAVSIIAQMISDAIKCFKEQSDFAKSTTEHLLDELFFINRSLSMIYTFKIA